MDDNDAQRHLHSIANAATRLHTSAREGQVVWHEWGTGTPLVLLHGGSGSWNHWVHTIPIFADHYRVLAADIPGLGDSPTPREPHSIESVAEILSEGLDQLIPDNKPFVVVGFSFGGFCAGHLALRQARRLKRLVIVGSPPFGLGPINSANEITPFNQAWSFAQAQPVHRKNLELLMMSDPAKVDALAVRIHHDNLRRARLRTRKLARNNALSDVLPDANCVVHGIWGEKDVTVYPGIDAVRDLFLDTHPQATFDLLPDTGHWAAYENSVMFNELLRHRLEGGLS